MARILHIGRPIFNLNQRQDYCRLSTVDIEMKKQKKKNTKNEYERNVRILYRVIESIQPNLFLFGFYIFFFSFFLFFILHVHFAHWFYVYNNHISNNTKQKKKIWYFFPSFCKMVRTHSLSHKGAHTHTCSLKAIDAYTQRYAQL